MRTVTIAVVLGMTLQSLQAQWSTDTTVNNPICNNFQDQRTPKAASDGSGGAIIVWSDARISGTANQDIFAQRITSAGTVAWTLNGDTVCVASGHDQNPEIIEDGSGGVIIVWEHHSATPDIYAQRLDASGTPLWTANGVSVCGVTNQQLLPIITSDGAGGAIIVWKDLRGGTTWDIYAQRIDANGTAQWTAGGVPVCVQGFDQDFHSITPDGSGGAIIAWRDVRNGSHYDIYAQHLNANGDTLWAANGIPISAASGYQQFPSVTTDGSGGAIIIWQDARVGSVYGQRVNSAGDTLWSANGIPLVNSPGGGANAGPLAVSDGSGGAIVAWLDTRNLTGQNVYALRIDGNGDDLWTANGVRLATLGGAQHHAIVGDGAGGAIITWETVSGTANVYAQKVNSSGGNEWPSSNGAPVATASGTHQQLPTVVLDESGGAIVAWEDQRDMVNFSTDIFASHLGSDGVLPVEMVGMGGEYRQQTSDVRLSWRTASEVDNVGWEVERRTIANFESTIANFQKVGFVEGAGTSSSPREYSFTDDISQLPIRNPQSRLVYRLKQIDRNGDHAYSGEAEIEVGLAPRDFSLGQNYPNPFNPTTAITFTLPEDGHVTLEVFDLLGRRVASLFNEPALSGRLLSATFDASQLPSGIYFARLQSGTRQLLKKMTLMK